LYNEYKRTRSEEVLNLRRRYQRMVRNYIIAYKRLEWNRACTKLEQTKNPTLFWKKFHQLTGTTTLSTYPIIHNQQAPQTDNEKANAFASHFEKVYSPQNTFTLPFHEKVEATIIANDDKHKPNERDINDMPNTLLNEAITQEEIRSIVRHKKSTAPGPDNITYRHIKEGPTILFELLAVLYTFLLRAGLYPPQFKVSHMILFLKPNKDPTNPGSYRPIQLTSTLGKVLERIIVKRLHGILANKSILPLSQAGFRPSSSTHDQLLRLTNIITHQFNRIQPSCLLLFDIEKAFDHVWHAGLLYKLQRYRFPLYFIRFITSFLKERLIYIIINQAKSRAIRPRTGVPQGSALSPLLYILYTADMPKPIPNIHHFLFADDTAFLATAPSIQVINSSLDRMIELFEIWCNRWKLKINGDKTQALVILPPNRTSRVYRNTSLLQLRVGGIKIPIAKTAKYLGITFDRHLTWNAHLNEVNRKAQNRLNLLKRLCGTSWGLHPQTLINTYKTFLRPLLTYGFTAWVSASAKYYERLKILERHALRTAYRIKLPSPTQELYNRINFPEITAHIASLRYNYIAKRIGTDHPLMQDIIRTDLNISAAPRFHFAPLDHLLALYVRKSVTRKHRVRHLILIANVLTNPMVCLFLLSR